MCTACINVATVAFEVCHKLFPTPEDSYFYETL